PTNGKILLGDFNGDGRVDICVCDAEINKLYVALSDGTKFINKGVWSIFGGTSGHYRSTPFVADVNGDGLSDIIVPMTFPIFFFDFYINSRTSFEYRKSVTPNIPPHWDVLFMADFEGDGITDICEAGLGVCFGKWQIGALLDPNQTKTGFGSLGSPFITTMLMEKSKGRSLMV
ncbi:MAG: VCBS repeat-containing protein, partial [Candidatus Omnitrophica bacterium]|nr:VCBS repeat-containing protein [Candidatus Omnitrophota bacterium]